jgi:hypothetical protein
VLIFSGSLKAETLKTYNFTANFVDCVKGHENEKSYYTSSGLAESGLMNGADKIPSGSIDGNYWDYMECLSLADGGTRNHTLAEVDTCPEIRFSVNQRSYYVPPAADGKIIGMAGNYWRCDAGAWTTESGVVSGPDITPTPSPVNEDKEQCGVQASLSTNRCLFSVTVDDLGVSTSGSLLKKNHGSSISLSYGPDYGDYDATHQGHSQAICNDGNWELQAGETQCSELMCNVGESVTWSGISEGKQVICDGTIAEDGTVIANSTQGGLDPTIFADIFFARAMSKVMEGEAVFACGVNGWQEVTSTCKRLKPAELTCEGYPGRNGYYYCY